MAKDEEVNQLRKEIDAATSYNKESLVHRDKWGEITFEGAQRDYDRIFSILGYLRILPLEFLTDSAISAIINSVVQLKAVLEQVDKFNIQAGNPAGTRDSLRNNIHSQADSLYTTTAQWIPFLAYQKGDVAQNIEQLATAVTKSQQMVVKAQEDISAKKEEIDGIIVKAREASASAGAAVFTKDFQNESDSLSRRAGAWLRTTWILAVITLIIAGLMWYFTEEGLDQNQIWQKLTTKLAILGLLLSATAWCGKIYKSLVHQSFVNRHRALSLQTFQAFSSAASDLQTKDAVLLQTTRAIFSDFGTGFVESGHRGSESDVKVLEVLRSFLPKGDSK